MPNPDRDNPADPMAPGKPRLRKKRLRSPLARKQLFFILMFSSIITLAGTGYQIYAEYQTDMKSIDFQLEQVRQGFLPSLIISLWNLDDNQLHILLSNMLSLRDVARLEIYEGHKLTYSAGTLAPDTKHLRRTYDMHHIRDGQTVKIGTLHAIATLSGVHGRLTKRLMMVLSTQGIKTFLVSLFILAIIHYLVTRHLHAMSSHVHQLDPFHPGQPLKLPKRIGPSDELDDVVGALNSMENRLVQHIQDKEAATKVLGENENRLRRSQNLLKTVLSSLDEVVLLVEPQGHLIVDVNATVHRIFGYNHGELLGYCTEVLFVNRAQFGRFDGDCQAALQDRGFYETTYQMRRKDGVVFDTEHYVTKISSQHGTPELEVSIIRDISRRKILESRIRHAQKIEAVGTLTGGIAHDFNNIIGIIMGNTELALELIDKRQPGRRQLEEIMAASNRAKEIIGQLLNYGLKKEHLLVPIDLPPIVEGTVKLLRPSIESDIEFQVRIEKNVSTIQADPSQIHQVVLNLCSNAMQAMENRGGRMALRLKNESLADSELCHRMNLTPGPYVKLSVSDTGQGIEAEHLNKVFDPYFTTKETGKGTGLGLAVVQGIVKTHHGAVAIESALGKGTRICVYFPAVELPAKPIHVDEPAKAIEISSEKANILIVDDEPQLVQMGKLMLQKLGYVVETTTRPEEAIELIRSAPSRLDLLITDFSMPSMSGLELAARIHRMQPDLPIILCSGITTRLGIEDTSAAGVTAILAKPYTIDQLAETLSAALAHGRA